MRPSSRSRAHEPGTDAAKRRPEVASVGQSAKTIAEVVRVTDPERGESHDFSRVEDVNIVPVPKSGDEYSELSSTHHCGIRERRHPAVTRTPIHRWR